jgi:hypothetical protein
MLQMRLYVVPIGYNNTEQIEFEWRSTREGAGEIDVNL